MSPPDDHNTDGLIPAHSDPLPGGGSVGSFDELSPETQKALEGIAKLGDNRIEDEEPDEDDDDGESPEDAANAAAAAAAEDVENPPKPAAVTPPPAVDPPPPAEKEPEDQRFSAGLSKLREQEEGLAAKAKEYEPRFAAADAYQDRLKTFGGDPVGAVRAFIVDALGTDDEEKVKAAQSKLYNGLTLTELGLPIDSEASEAATARHELAQYKREQAAKEETRDAEQKKARQDRETQQAVNTIAATFDEQKASYPFLAAQKAPADVLWEFVVTQYTERGVEMTFPDAAKAVNDHIEEEITAQYSHLFAPSGETPDVKQETPTSKPRTRAPSNAAASTVATPAKKKRKVYIEDREESIKNALKLLPQDDPEDDD